MSDTPKDPSTDPSDQDPKGPDTETPEESDRATGGTDGEGPDGSDGSEDETPVSAAEFKKLQAKAARREDKLREAQAKIKELEGKAEGGAEEDPVALANQKLIRASARTALAGAGVTDRSIQADVLELINLSDIEVDSSGDPDEDEIADRIERLRNALGVKTPKEQRRTPARSTADRGANQGPPVDPDSKRYRAFLQS